MTAMDDKWTQMAWTGPPVDAGGGAAEMAGPPVSCLLSQASSKTRSSGAWVSRTI